MPWKRLLVATASIDFLRRRWIHSSSARIFSSEALESVLNQIEQGHLTVKFADSYADLIRRCCDSGSLDLARRLHAQVVIAGHGESSYIAGLLVHLYVKCGDLEGAWRVFDAIAVKNRAVLWNILIGEYDRIGDGCRALDLYKRMEAEPDKVTFVLALRVCAGLRSLGEGMAVYERLCSSIHLKHDIKLQNGAISMFAKCGALDLAVRVFDQMPERDVVSWNSIITAFAHSGHSLECVHFYHRMLLEGFRPNGVTFSGVASSCSGREELDTIQASIAASDFHSNVVVKNSLVSAYTRSGDLRSARKVFDSIEDKDLISWNSMVVAYSQHGHGEEMLELFRKMDVEPDSITYASILGACSAMELLELGKEVHARVSRSRFKSDPALAAALINMYSKCGVLESARRVFDGIQSVDPSPWNAMISGLVQHGRAREALGLFERMKAESVRIDKVSYLTILSACCALEDLHEGIRIHEHASACGMGKDLVVETAVFNMYSKCRQVDLARKMFDGMNEKTVISWNVMIATYSQADDKLLNRQGLDLYGLMEAEGVQADERTFIHLLSACVNLGAVEEARAIHKRILASGCKASEVLETAIVTMYARFDMLEASRSNFDRMEKKSVTAWNAMISSYAQHGQASKSLLLFHQMSLEGVKPDARTFVSVIGACSSLQALEKGRAVEEQATSMGIEEGRTALLSLYAKCGNLEAARDIFDKLKYRKNVVSWNSMIAAYAQSGRGREALELYELMKEEGVQPDDITYAGALGACTSYGGSAKGVEIHSRITESKIRTDVFLDTAIVNMYAKCGELETAMSYFEKMRRKNAVTWSAMVGAFIQHGYDREALDLYLRMVSEGFQPSEITLAGALAACSRIGALQEGKAIHSRIQATETLQNCLFLQNSLLNMYAKCGCLAIANTMFSNLQRRDSFSWNTIIVGHAHHGDVDEVLSLHGEMVQDGVDPDYVTFACVLLACSHAGLLDRGRSHFLSMEMEFGVAHDTEHYLCMVDLLSRAGRVESAEELVHSMPYEPPAMGWTTLLGSSEVQADLDRGSRYAEVAAGLEPGSSSSYVLLWNIYSRSKTDASGLEHLFL
ncbi:pentatricopeptide repeat-containing protein At5g27110 isoform X1 [Selaginella moellendorffii]|uniref:pentatricopeptide repeat-containing protein At5g27110 isoform X1 n=1 Tax=Selaginella moellendorffii TaxID=88036 RepID=UPI000D1C5C5F|nr:pentatricopeptide repeat-containing protein At5g27110 isoform X1 [Selaginella moellendorffii]|eukprot:XP_024525375.1 pentatricopeptide repeat-containing protein At5g27110 isoform X1 [Selaginella moellendorffii]